MQESEWRGEGCYINTLVVWKTWCGHPAVSEKPGRIRGTCCCCGWTSTQMSMAPYTTSWWRWLNQQHLPGKFRDSVLDYQNVFDLRFSSGTWEWLESRTITGCTVSVIRFTLVVNTLVKCAEVEARGPLTQSGVRQPPIRAFMGMI